VFFHVIAPLSSGRRKSVYNKTDEQALALAVQFLKNGTISATWGSRAQTYQVLELRVYSTTSAWHKPSGGSLEEFIKGKRNLFPSFEKRAKKLLGDDAFRVFVIMPIQGEEYGSQDEQRIFVAVHGFLQNCCWSIGMNRLSRMNATDVHGGRSTRVDRGGECPAEEGLLHIVQAAVERHREAASVSGPSGKTAEAPSRRAAWTRPAPAAVVSARAGGRHEDLRVEG